MVPDQQGGAAAQQEPPPNEEEKKLGKLSAVEQVVNEYSRKFAKRYRVDEDSYTIILSTEFAKGIMGIRRGPVAQIILAWPDAQPSINTLLDSAFKTISRSKLVDSMAVEPVLHIKRRAEERRRWVRTRLGSDEADIILDLVPKHRIRTTVITSVKYEDVITGESITVTHHEKPEQYRGQDVSTWMRLSRIVRDNHPEEATRYNDEGAEVSATSDHQQDSVASEGESATDTPAVDDVAGQGIEQAS
jgi:hypothetical protein